MSIGLSRRTILQAGAAGVAAMALPSIAFASEEDYGGLPVGIQSYTLRDRPFKNALEAIHKDFDLAYVEVFSRHLGWADKPEMVKMNGVAAKMDDAKALLDEYKVKAVSIGAVPITKKEKATREIFDFAKAMGMKNITISPNPDALDLLDKLCDEYDITASIHDHGPDDKHWGHISQIEAGIKDHNKKIGLCNDTGHFVRAGDDPLEACHRLKDRMYAMHLKDFKKDANGKWQDCILGEGDLDVDAIVKFLLDMKFRGVLAIEYEGGAPVESVKKSLERLKQAVKKAKA